MKFVRKGIIILRKTRNQHVLH